MPVATKYRGKSGAHWNYCPVHVQSGRGLCAVYTGLQLSQPDSLLYNILNLMLMMPIVCIHLYVHMCTGTYTPLYGLN